MPGVKRPKLIHVAGSYCRARIGPSGARTRDGSAIPAQTYHRMTETHDVRMSLGGRRAEANGMLLLGLACVVWFSLSLPTLLIAQSTAEWQAAAQRIVRLPPAVFTGVPVSVRTDLEHRGCRIPQLGPAFGSHLSNLIGGEFARPGQRDWAVLCSRGDSSEILLYWGGRTDQVEVRALAADAASLQSMGPVGIQYSRYLAVADSATIVTHAREYGGPLPPGPITHDGLEVGFAEKASAISYWHNGRWYSLQGAD
jgi:hypothetical protein